MFYKTTTIKDAAHTQQQRKFSPSRAGILENVSNGSFLLGYAMYCDELVFGSLRRQLYTSMMRVIQILFAYVNQYHHNNFIQNGN